MADNNENIFKSIGGHVLKAVDVVNNIIDRCDKVAGAKDDVTSLRETFTRIQNDIRGIEVTGISLLSVRAQREVEGRLTEIHEIVEKYVSKLEQLNEELQSEQPVDIILAVMRAPKTAETLQSVESDAKHCTVLLSIISGTLAGIESAPRIHAGGASSVFTGASSNEQYRPSFPLQGNLRATSLTFDFESVTKNGTFATFEGRLKSHLLGSSSMVGAVDNRARRSGGAVAYGGGGVGKTCALLEIAKLQDVLERFPDGIFFCTLGRDACVENVIDMLSDFVENSGGELRASDMRTSTLDQAIRRASIWFSGKACLFIVDDIWKSRNIPADLLQKLSTMTITSSPTTSGSRFVYSTRDEQIAKAVDGTVVQFSHRDSQTSREMLFNAAEWPVEDSSDSPDEFYCDRILDACGGLPFTLNIAGRLILRMKRGWIGSPREAWRQCAERLQDQRDILEQGNENGKTLYVSLLASVEFLDHHRSSVDQCTFKRAVESLCILKRQDWVPLSVCEHLWGVKETTARQDMRDSLSELNIVKEENREIESRQVLGFRFHDHVHALATDLAGGDSGVKSWIHRVVASYEETLNPENELICWPALLEEDGYIVENICRILLKDGNRRAVGKTLSSGQWMTKMMTTGRVLQYDRDTHAFMAELDAKFERDHPLKTMARILRLSQPHCVGNEHAAWFELNARLQTAQPPQDWVSRFLRETQGRLEHLVHGEGDFIKTDWMTSIMKEAEQLAPHPFLRAAAPCLLYPTSALIDYQSCGFHVWDVKYIADGSIVACGLGQFEQTKISVFIAEDGTKPEQIALQTGHLERETGGECTTICLSERGDYVVSAHVNKKLRLWDISSATQVREIITDHSHPICSICTSADCARIVSGSEDGTLRVWEEYDGVLVRAPLTGHSEYVTCVSFSSDGSRIVSGSCDQTVRVWDARSGMPVCELLIGHSESVWSACFSADGARIVSGSGNGKVCVWDAHTGASVGAPLNRLDSSLSIVRFSIDGAQIVSGSTDGTLCVWDTHSGAAVGSPLTGHSDVARCVSFSMDGTRFVSGSNDGTLRVWDVRGDAPSGAPLTGHSHAVNCVSFSTDGARIVTGSTDSTVRIWDARSGGPVCAPLSGHSSIVICVHFSKDGARIVSGSTDHTVRVWDARRGAQVGAPLTGHSDWVQCVRFSSDGTRVVSGSRDRTVRVWDAHSGAAVGAPLRGHSGVVSIVRVSADGMRIVSISHGDEGDDTVRFWNVGSGTAPRILVSKDEDSWFAAERATDEFLLGSSGCSYAPERKFDTRGRGLYTAIGGSRWTLVAMFDSHIRDISEAGDGSTVCVGLLSGVVAVLSVAEET